MSEEDLRTWTLAYSLSIDVYVCAERYLMNDLKTCISNYIINQFEIAGHDAAQPGVLVSCKVLHAGVPTSDPLLKKVFARVGFLQTRMRKNFRSYANEFFLENPELTNLIMQEMGERTEEDVKDHLPSMDRPLIPPPPRDDVIIPGPRRRYDHNGYR